MVDSCANRLQRLAGSRPSRAGGIVMDIAFDAKADPEI